MADAVLFEFLHMEMVAELWAYDPGPGGQKTSLSVLESMGFRVGQALGERLPRETLAFREELDALKFLCKDLWAAVFQKQIDGLRTNHQVRPCPCPRPGPSPAASFLEAEAATGKSEPGLSQEGRPAQDGGSSLPRARGQEPGFPTHPQGTYVLQDNSFPLLVRMASGLQYLEEAPKFLAFTCGLLRGALSTLGLKSSVTASVAALPTCKFQVVIQKS
ncbi:trafficking protein particle complex subunit 6A isoform X1 [Dasypus novemcinctus]|uniref:trafficking protein particle complex subunit 6A isoform X1 n=1 Tax=Dasypus novemcinctus TaxID=9361 RepID=UPI0003288B47|nr:trafficking protein particle complex subunit 6A isoform X1 [Dasypus novemcinctus]